MAGQDDMYEFTDIVFSASQLTRLLLFLATMSFETTATIASFGGKLLKLAHKASSTQCQMKLNLYLPPHAQSGKVPVLVYLAGLTCTGDNGAEKGFLQHRASQKGIAVVFPDTSPRMHGIFFGLWTN